MVSGVLCEKVFIFAEYFLGQALLEAGTQHPAHSTAQRISFYLSFFLFGYGDGLLIAKGQEHTYGL
jgi:hypothetical protein